MKKFLFSFFIIAIVGAIIHYLPNLIEIVCNVKEINITFNLIKVL